MIHKQSNNTAFFFTEEKARMITVHIVFGTLPKNDDYEISFITYLHLIAREHKISIMTHITQIIWHNEQINTTIAKGDELANNKLKGRPEKECTTFALQIQGNVIGYVQNAMNVISSPPSFT